MIESPPEAIAFEPLATEDIDSTINKSPEEPLTRARPITSSFRATLRHLGGFRARFRGIWMYIVMAIAINFVGNLFAAAPLLRFVPRPLWNVLATVICATLPLTWTHIVISEASQKPWYRRLPPMKVWKKVAAPTAIVGVAEQLSIFLPVYLAIVTGLTEKKSQDVANMTQGQRVAYIFLSLGILLFGLVLAFFIVIPAKVTLVRVQASLLPDSEETIVPFDRSFGGKVIPEIVGGSGVIGMLDAWKTFDWAARIRLVKAYFKVFAMQVAVSLVFILCFVGEMFLIAGTNWSKFLPEDGDQQL